MSNVPTQAASVQSNLEFAELFRNNEFVAVSPIACDDCGVVFRMPKQLADYREKIGKPIWCPGCGHKIHFLKPEVPAPKVDDDRLRQLHEEEQREAREADLRRQKRKPDDK